MSIFKFKHFEIKQSDSAMKVGTDAMLLGSLVDSKGKKTALDVGSGTGVLSLMLAQKNIDLLIDSVEIDELASKECQFNFVESKWNDRLSVWNTDFLLLPKMRHYDLIISNPPYYSSTNVSKDTRVAIAKHVCSLPVEEFVKKVLSLLKVGGHFWVIIPTSEVGKWWFYGELNGFRIKEKISIKGKQNKESNRSVLCFDKETVLTKEQHFVVRNEDGTYTEEYIELTKDFHGVDLKKDY